MGDFRHFAAELTARFAVIFPNHLPLVPEDPPAVVWIRFREHATSVGFRQIRHEHCQVDDRAGVAWGEEQLAERVLESGHSIVQCQKVLYEVHQ